MKARHKSKVLLAFYAFTLQVHFVQAEIALDSNTAYHNPASIKIRKLLKQIKDEENYENALIYNALSTNAEARRVERCPFNELLSEWKLPLVLMTPGNNFDYKYKHNSELIILACIRQLDVSDVTPKHMKSARHVIYVEREFVASDVQQLCQNFFKLDIYNVLITLQDREGTHYYYSCQKLPPTEQHFRPRSLNDSAIIYQNQFLNMHGLPLVTQPDQLLARTLMHYDETGKLHMGGYVGEAITNFAKRHNATLLYKQPIELRKTVFFGSLLEATRNGSLDIAAVMAPTSMLGEADRATYPYEIIDYCFMIPLPQDVPINEIFTYIIASNILLTIFAITIIYGLLLNCGLKRRYSCVNVFLSDKSLRGMLGQSFTLVANPTFNVKFICFQLCYMSLVISTTYQAYLQSYLTHPPLRPIIRSYEDMEVVGIKIATTGLQLNNIPKYNHPSNDFKHLMVVFEDPMELVKIRSALNTSYAFLVSSSGWTLFEEQQRNFARQMFYYQNELCVIKAMPHFIPVRPDLPYRELFVQYMMHIHESGLFGHWRSMGIYDMVRYGYLTLKDLSTATDYSGPIDMEGFYWIWIFYLLSMVISMLGFVWEWMEYRIMKICHWKLRNIEVRFAY